MQIQIPIQNITNIICKIEYFSKYSSTGRMFKLLRMNFIKKTFKHN